MYPTIQRLGLNDLSDEDRLLLVQEIWDSLEARKLPQTTDVVRKELERRRDDLFANPEQPLYSWEEVKRHARGME